MLALTHIQILMACLHSHMRSMPHTSTTPAEAVSACNMRMRICAECKDVYKYSQQLLQCNQVLCTTLLLFNPGNMCAAQLKKKCRLLTTMRALQTFSLHVAAPTKRAAVALASMPLKVLDMHWCTA
jgi:hypothetical protein